MVVKLGVREVRKRTLNKLTRNKKGQALIIVLILMLLGGLIIAPLLAYISTGIKVGKEVFENKMYEFYAADAGVDDALWYLQSDVRLGAKFDASHYTNPNWTVDDIPWPIEYELGDLMNEKGVAVTIDRVWLLGNLPPSLGLPVSQPAKGSSANANDYWTVVGAVNIDNTTNYIVDITTNESASINVDHIGVWLPQGYSYVTGSVKINGVAIGGAGDTLHLVKNPTSSIPHCGGTALIWDYSGRTFKQLSDIAPPPPGGGVTPAEKFPPSVRLSFNYAGGEAKGFFPWIKLADGRIAWDTEAGIYHVQSLATKPGAEEGTTVEAYAPRGLVRYTSGSGGVSSSIQGDYLAIGNSLMTECWWRHTVSGRTVTEPGPPCNYSCTYNCRGKYYSESSATVNSNAAPSDAKIEKAYLYWTAWWQTNGADTNAILKVNGHLITPKEVGGVPVGPAGTVVADRYYVLPTSGSNGYQYACFADVTNQVKAITDPDKTGIYDVNNTSFTVGGVDAIPADTCSQTPLWRQATNAGWSMIIIYSSPEMDPHQIYLYDNLAYLWDYYGARADFTILGFEVPSGGNSDAKLTVFAAEGDAWISPDYVEFQRQGSTSWYYLGDSSSSDPNPWNNVFNGYSSATGFTPQQLDGQDPGEISGVDIDTYTKDKNNYLLSNIVQTGDTWAKIRVETVGSGSGCDGIMLAYIVFSVRSTKVPAGEEFQVGTMTYEIK